jgi:hypothetical protein
MQIFEGVKGVVMNENIDWSLSRQQVRGMINRMFQSIQLRFPTVDRSLGMIGNVVLHNSCFHCR